MTYILFNLIDTMIFDSIDVLFIDKLIYRFYSSSPFCWFDFTVNIYIKFYHIYLNL